MKHLGWVCAVRRNVSALNLTLLSLLAFGSVQSIAGVGDTTSVSKVKFIGTIDCPMFCPQNHEVGPGLIREIITIAYSEGFGFEPEVVIKARGEHLARASVSLGVYDLALGSKSGFDKNPRTSSVSTPVFNMSVGFIYKVGGVFDEMNIVNSYDERLLDMKIGLIEKAEWPSEMDHIYSPKINNGTVVFFESKDYYKNAVAMIESGEIDFIMDSIDFVVPSLIHYQNVEVLKVTPLALKVPLHIGYSNYNNRGKSIGAIIESSMMSMSSDGRLRALQLKYLGFTEDSVTGP